MPFTLTTDAVEVSGSVTINEAVASGLFTQTQGAVLELQHNVTLMDGADLSKLKGLIFDLNGFDFQPETPGNCPQLSGIGFIYNGDTANGGAENQWGAHHLNLKDCSIFGRSSKETFGMALAENVIVTSSYDPSDTGHRQDAGAGLAPFFTRGGVFSGVSLYEPFRLGLVGTGDDSSVGRYHLKDIVVETSGEFLVGYNSAPESIWENCRFEGNTTFNVDTYQNDTRENTMLLLGSSIDAFFDGGTSFPRSNAHDNFRCYTGGKRYFNVLNATGMRFEFRASVNGASVSQPVVVSREIDHLLGDTFVEVGSDSENIELTLITGIWNPGGSFGGGGLANYSDFRLTGIAYGKEIYAQDLTQTEAEAVQGNANAYVPFTVPDDAFVSEPDKSVVDAYSEITTPQQFYDRAKAQLVDAYVGQAETFVTREGDTVIVPGRDVVIDAMAAEVLNITDTTLTLKADTFTGNLQLDSDKTLSFENEAVINGVYSDSTRDSAVELLGVNLAPASNTLEVSTDGGTTWQGLATHTYAYASATNQSVLFRYTKGDGESGAPIVYTDDYVLASGLDNTFTSFTNETGQLINAQTSALQSSLNTLQTTLVSAINRAGQIPTQGEWDALMQGTAEAIKDQFKSAASQSVDSTALVNAILDCPYGSRTDGSPLGSGTLGEHWYVFYPPEIIRQLLETTLNGLTDATRNQPQPGTYGPNTFGDAIREVLNRASEETAAEARDHARAANVQTQEN